MSGGGGDLAGTSPYSTGDGGTVLEHRYGAVLLTRGPIPELGDDVTLVSVRFQAGPVSAVDDLLATGDDQHGGKRCRPANGDQLLSWRRRLSALRTALASGPSRGSNRADTAVCCLRRLRRSLASSGGCHPC
jgi:hypothetical protein